LPVNAQALIPRSSAKSFITEEFKAAVSNMEPLAMVATPSRVNIPPKDTFVAGFVCAVLVIVKE